MPRETQDKGHEGIPIDEFVSSLGSLADGKSPEQLEAMYGGMYFLAQSLLHDWVQRG